MKQRTLKSYARRTGMFLDEVRVIGRFKGKSLERTARVFTLQLRERDAMRVEELAELFACESRTD